jgi:adenine-specific DNA-methyltransferase
VPYNGEEVLLHWANKDQYYIKTGEQFTSFKFYLDGSDKSVWFKVAQAETEKDNVKEEESRSFVLRPENPIEVDGDELTLWFEYRPLTDEEEEKWLNLYKKVEKSRKTVDRSVLCVAYSAFVLNEVEKEWRDLLSVIPKNKDRSILYQKLNHYTGKNTTDYFIHKDLKSFLDRELEYYLKNEVIRVDDFIEDQSQQAMDVALSRAKVISKISQNIIAFLSQIENFQKKLFEKQKFVVDTHYCFTLDKVPEELYGTILKNEEQLQSWEELYEMDKWDGGLEWDGKWTKEFLKQHPNMMVDTRFFEEEFSYEVFAAIENLDDNLLGLLIHGDNFQALNALNEKYKSKIKTTYIDPPYNSGSDDFPYKDGLRNSSWLTMLNDRISLADGLLTEDAVIFASVDDKDETNRVSHKFMQLLEHLYGSNNYLDNLIWVKNTTHNDAKAFSHNHEYILTFTKDKRKAIQKSDMFRQAKPGYSDVMDLANKLNKNYPPISEIQDKLKDLYKNRTEVYKQECLQQGLAWDDETKKNDPWKGIKQYKYAEYRSDNGEWVPENKAKEEEAQIWVYREDNPSWPNANTLTKSHRDPESDDYRFYKPTHPVTKNECPAPATGWRWRKSNKPNKPDVLSFEKLLDQHLIAFGDDENKIPQYKRFLKNVDTDVVKSVITDFTDGEKELTNLMGNRGTFPNPKPTSIIRKLIEITSNDADIIIDYFAGSGTTGHAIINQNKVDDAFRKYILSDLNPSFLTVLVPRIKKVVFSDTWKDGVPQDQDGQSHAFKYHFIESYEDALNNIDFKNPADAQQAMEFEDYMLHYMLDFETQGVSATLLKEEAFETPFDYQLNIQRGHDSPKSETVDMVETFHYLIGLWVKTLRKHEHQNRKYVVSRGQIRNEDATEEVCVIWRNTKDLDLDKESKWVQETIIKDQTFDRIYINGLTKVKDAEPIELTFREKMFEDIA